MTARLILVWGAAAVAACAQVSTWVSQGGVNGAESGGNVVYFGAEFAGATKAVKGSPYSAQIVTEHTQTLTDGNTISQKQGGALYRDSEGRTRREQALGPIGPVPADASSPDLIFINDPVAGVSYVLDASRKTAQKIPLAQGRLARPVTVAAAAPLGEGFAPDPEVRINLQSTNVRLGVKTAAQPSAQESLGTKVIEGVQAEGTRTTMTIAAGQIGNKLPIQTVTERWYSPQLKATVLITTDDPMMGRTVYQLTNISLAEPPAALFEVPSDYTTTEGTDKGQVLFTPKPAK
jgi:hypothetical protein